jgi:hypothetical protein
MEETIWELRNEICEGLVTYLLYEDIRIRSAFAELASSTKSSVSCAAVYVSVLCLANYLSFSDWMLRCHLRCCRNLHRQRRAFIQTSRPCCGSMRA